jgi:hypothetical protein
MPAKPLESSMWAGNCFGVEVRKPTTSNRRCENGQSVVRSFEPLPHRPVALLDVVVEHYLAGKCICWHSHQSMAVLNCGRLSGYGRGLIPIVAGLSVLYLIASLTCVVFTYWMIFLLIRCRLGEAVQDTEGQIVADT